MTERKSDDFTLQVLPVRLLVASVEKHRLAEVMHAIVGQILVPQNGSAATTATTTTTTPFQFFSMTETLRELSLILDPRSLSAFPAHLLTVCPKVWRCLEVQVGAMGDVGGDLANTVHRIAQPLARHQISIFQLSTFDADYTLVPEQDLPRALACLEKDFAIIRGDLDNPEMDLFPGSPEIRAPVEVSTFPETESPHSSDILQTNTFAGPKKHTFSLPIPSEESVYIASFPSSSQSHLWQPLLRSLFYTPEKPVLSMTCVDDCISLVLTQQTLSLFPVEHLNVYRWTEPNNAWALVAIGEGLGFEETGIVARYTRTLKESNVPCFYLSTFYNDLILVPRSCIDKVLDQWKTLDSP